MNEANARSSASTAEGCAASASGIFVPERLRARDQFVVYRLEERDSKETKVPYSARGGGKASTTRASTWASHQTAAAYAEQQGWVDGLGFVFSPHDSLAGVDLDHCRDPEAGAIDEWALRIIKFFDSYAEVSPSGTGVHLLVGGVLPAGGRKHDRIEIYDRSRFFTLTGNHLDGTPWTVEDRQEQLDELYGLLGGAHEDRSLDQSFRSAAAPVRVFERLQVALASKNGHKLRALLDGDDGAYGDDASDADMAACCILAWYLDHDVGAVDQIIRTSARYRAKWDEPHYSGGETYGAHTIREATRFVGADCYGADRRHFEERRSEPPTPANANALRSSSLHADSIAEWLGSEDSPLDVVIGDAGEGAVLPIDGKGFIAGPTGVGKTNLLLRLGRSLAEGTDFLRLPIPVRRRVLHLAVEGSRRGMRRRLKKIWADAPADARDRYFLALVQLNLAEDGEQLDALVERCQPEVLIIDPLRNAHPWDENRSDETSRLTALLDGIISRHRCALICAHHDRKRDPRALRDSSIDRVRGSTALTGWLSFCLSVERHPKLPDVLNTEWTKVRDAEEALPLLQLELKRSTLSFDVEARSEEVDIPDIILTIVYHAGEIRRPDLTAGGTEQTGKGQRVVEDNIRALERDGKLIKFRKPDDRADWFRLGESLGTVDGED